MKMCFRKWALVDISWALFTWHKTFKCFLITHYFGQNGAFLSNCFQTHDVHAFIFRVELTIRSFRLLIVLTYYVSEEDVGCNTGAQDVEKRKVKRGIRYKQRAVEKEQITKKDGGEGELTGEQANNYS